MKLPTTKARAIERAGNSLAAFATLMYPKFEVAQHHRRIIDVLEKVERGEIDRVVIATPPRHGKSLLASVLFPSWYLGRHPDRSIIATSYGQSLAQDFGRQVRNYTADRLHSAIFPLCVPSEDSASVNRFSLLQGGNYFGTGSGGPIVGRGCDVLLIDDPIKSAEDARSDTFRENLKTWYRSTAYTRLAPGGAVILISTRWHEDDLAGWLLKEHPEENWTVLNLPAIAERDEPGGRKEGEALWSSRFPIETLERIKEAVGGAAWQALYQGRPAAAEGAMFRRAWWKISATVPETFERIVLSLDTAFKQKSTSDWSVGITLGVAQSAFYILDIWRERVDFPELQRKVNALAERWRPNQILIEDQASGQSLTQSLQASSRLPVKPIKVDRDKVSRAAAILPLIEAGRVVLPAGAEWMAQFVDECATFPNGAYDDCVDALSQCLNYLSGVGATGHVAYMNLQKARASVAAGVTVEDAAKSAGVAVGRLDAWVERSTSAGVAQRLARMSSRPPAGQEEAWEFARKRMDAGASAEEAVAEALAVHRAAIAPESLSAYWQRSNAPTGPARPRYAPENATRLSLTEAALAPRWSPWMGTPEPK
jgi:predicted phage terminase large subunit-like protein